jgi:uncharacterized protein
MDAEKTTITALPQEVKSRIELLDILRGIALLGILLMNIPFFAAPYMYEKNLILSDDMSGPGYYIWWVVNGVFEGTMRGLFTLLFGAGCLLLMLRFEDRKGANSAADIHYRRMIWLIVFGLIHGYILQWPGDILYLYGLVGLFIFPIRHWKPKSLLIASGILLTLLSIRDTAMIHSSNQMRKEGMALESRSEKGEDLEKKELEKLEEWRETTAKISIDSLKKSGEELKESVQGNWFSSFEIMAFYTFKLETKKAFTFLFWDALLGILLGMFLFKTGWIQGEKDNKSYLYLMLSGYISGLALSYLNLNALLSSQFDFTQYAEYNPVNLYQLKRIMLTLGHMSLIVLIWKSGLFAIFFTMLARVGRMAFSNYIAQTLICTTIFYGFGFGYFGELERAQWYLIVLCVWVILIIFSTIWLHLFQYGPLEWVWRRLTYWTRIPLKRVSSEEAILIDHDRKR